MRTKERESGIEIMRMILMMMIILHHIISYNFDLYENALKMNKGLCAVLFFLDASCIMAVNCFFLISGYFTIKFHLLKMIRLVMDAYFYYTVITLIGVWLNQVTVSKTVLIHLFDPVDHYWFISVYLILSVASRALNQYAEEMTRKQYLNFISCSFLILGVYGFVLNQPQLGLNAGYSIVEACCLYFIGAGMNKWKKNTSSLNMFFSWLGITAMNYSLIVISVFYIGKINLALRLLSYSNPLVVLQAIYFLKIFANLKIGTIASVNKMSKHSLAAYYVNSSNWLAMSFKNFVIPMLSAEMAVIVSIPYSIIAFFIAIFLDVVKCCLFDKFEMCVCEKLQAVGKIIFIKLQDAANQVL